MTIYILLEFLTKLIQTHPLQTFNNLLQPITLQEKKKHVISIDEYLSTLYLNSLAASLQTKRYEKRVCVFTARSFTAYSRNQRRTISEPLSPRLLVNKLDDCCQTKC